MRATLERLPVQSRQNFVGERRHRLRQDSQRVAVDLVAPAAALDPVPERKQKAAATRIGENRLQGAVARLALPFDRLAQAVEVDLRRRHYQASDGRAGENIPIAGRAELLHQPSCFAVDRLERRRWDLPPEQRTDGAQTAQGDAHLVHAFGVGSLLRHRVVTQKMMPAGTPQECNDVINRVLGSDADGFGLRRRLHDVERQRIAAFRLAPCADLQRRCVEQLGSEIKQHAGVAALQFELDLGQDFLTRTGLDGPFVERDFNRRIGQIELPSMPANFCRKRRHERIGGERRHRIADLGGGKPR